MTTEILIAILAGDGILAGVISSVVTWLLTKRKYDSDVDNSNIQNMSESLDFYIKLSDDYKNRLAAELESHNKEVAELRAENAELKKEMREQAKRFDEKFTTQQKEITLMKNQMLSVYGQVCLNFRCGERVLTDLPKTPKTSKTKKTGKDA